jgi:hypothetical protein
VAHFLNGETRIAEQLLTRSLADDSMDAAHRAQLLLHLSAIKAQQQDLQSAREILARATAEARQAASVPQRDFQEPSDLAREVQDATGPMLLLEQIGCRMAAYCVTSAIQNWSKMRGVHGADDPVVRVVTEFMRELEDVVQQLQPLPERPATAADRLSQLARETVGACRALTGTVSVAEEDNQPTEPESKLDDKEGEKTTNSSFQFERLTYPPQRTRSTLDTNVHHLIHSIGGLGMGCVTPARDSSAGL